MFKNLDKSQVIALLLVAALVVNAVVHFTSPAYRFYRDQFKLVEQRLDTKYNLFSSTVRTNVTDAVVEFYTNVIAMVSARPADVKGVVGQSVPGSPILPLVDNISYSYGLADDSSIATIGTQHYKVGQVFPRGGLITSISSDCIILDGRYRVGNASSPRSYKSVNKDDVYNVP